MPRKKVKELFSGPRKEPLIDRTLVAPPHNWYGKQEMGAAKKSRSEYIVTTNTDDTISAMKNYSFRDIIIDEDTPAEIVDHIIGKYQYNSRIRVVTQGTRTPQLAMRFREAGYRCTHHPRGLDNEERERE